MKNNQKGSEAASMQSEKNADFFCQRIQKGCRFIGTDVKHLSRRLNIPYTEMQQMLDGKHEIPHDLLWKTSLCTGLPLSFFYGNDEATELIEAYLKISNPHLAKEILATVVAMGNRRSRI